MSGEALSVSRRPEIPAISHSSVLRYCHYKVPFIYFIIIIF